MRCKSFLMLLVLALCNCSGPPDLVGDPPDAQADVDAEVATADAAPPPVDASPTPADAAVPVIDAGFSLACTLEEIAPVAQCAFDKCAGGLNLDAGLDTTQLATCIATSCFIELLSLSPSCIQCLTGGLSGDLTGLLGQCTGISLP